MGGLYRTAGVEVCNLTLDDVLWEEELVPTIFFYTIKLRVKVLMIRVYLTAMVLRYPLQVPIKDRSK